jgi:hypothetical protein
MTSNDLKQIIIFMHMTVCHIVNTGSCLITEVKQCQAGSIFGWVTAVKNWFNLCYLLRCLVLYKTQRALMPEPTGTAI